jgi:hypothetical protein
MTGFLLFVVCLVGSLAWFVARRRAHTRRLREHTARIEALLADLGCQPPSSESRVPAQTPIAPGSQDAPAELTAWQKYMKEVEARRAHQWPDPDRPGWDMNGSLLE